MKTIIDSELQRLRLSGNLRSIPNGNADPARVDFTGNDYLGIGTDAELQEHFLSGHRDLPLSSGASRLLATNQDAYASFEDFLEQQYGQGRRALLFNSGYHANTGIVSALATKGTTIVADKLVHASIIDGMKLSGAPFERFRHNDFAHARKLVEKATAGGNRVLLIAETVYSMDGDSPDLNAVKSIKDDFPEVTVYLDEDHAVGVMGERGLGLAADLPWVDVIIGTLGKALASSGAYAITAPHIHDYLVNKARSFIFSTALPPLIVSWSEFVMRHAILMDEARDRLRNLARILATELGSPVASHIQPFIVGDPHKAVALSRELALQGFNVLPIRVPTVPAGTDRLRISLNAKLSDLSVRGLAEAIKKLNAHEI